MADNCFEENNKFLSITGTLGRRGFIVNYLIVVLIESLIFTTPLMYIIFFKPDMIENFLQITANPAMMPFSQSCMLWIIITGIISAVLLFPSVVRRVRDVVAQDDEQRIFMISSVLAVLFLFGYTPVNLAFPIKWISFFTVIFLMCVEGKITGQKPKSEVIKFNWGAFLGTWIWGLFNRTPVTALMLPLMLTSGWFPFMLICGLKGNEWAYKNKNYESPELLHKSQSNQAAIWAVIAPILFVAGFIVCLLLSSVALYKYTNANPEFEKKLKNYSQEYTEVAVKANFTKVELTDGEYKFYMEPQIWVKLPQRSKMNMFELASRYVEPKNSVQKSKDNSEFLKTANKIKIYSSFNNEILGEYYLEEKEFQKAYDSLVKNREFKQYAKTINSGYRINNHPTLP